MQWIKYSHRFKLGVLVVGTRIYNIFHPSDELKISSVFVIYEKDFRFLNKFDSINNLDITVLQNVELCIFVFFRLMFHSKLYILEAFEDLTFF